ncbi:hypothetical protein T069G_09047 [Trichoderma breve]|uniref:Coiled-coil domain-containing protein 16 n=1 Tax=Trichoderma breve TaxID=2034170 RepID=A0A9W9E2N3_9HYPO|nr:hypothetical protein T069G_09047 [Trichoderma breve]KAJ4855679.1 hypothetical protein T069G_09047 [Trichoderma breve]
MADVRALLRQQRAARRINHPYALYSDAGKLLCTLCRDHIRAESHWDAHLQSDKHKKRLSALNQSIVDDANAEVEDEDPEEDEHEAGEEEDAEDHDALAAQKRKLDQLGPEEKDTDLDDEDEARRKRSRPATASEDDPNRNKKPLMPTQGVQVQIASRSSTPSQPAVPKLATSLPSRQASNLATPASSSSMSISIQPQSSTASLSQSQQPAQPAQQVDEDEWAAFEADIAATSAAQDYDDDAVISRPAMTAEEAAAAAKETEEDAVQNPESRKSKADAEIEDEREEATRALEDEFEEMQELEARVQRLKEKREALMRKRSETLTQDQADDIQTAVKAVSDPQDEGKENVHTTGDATKPDADDDDEDDEDEEDDWDGFRFRTGR